MALEKKKKSEQKYHSNVEDFVPYAAHFDEETLITKNGELLQVIKITGFAFEMIKEGQEDQKDLRGLIRKAINNNIKDSNYSIWLHTIRREADISTGGVYKKFAANIINEKWVRNNNWRTQFVNELYITIIKEGESLPLKDPNVLIRELFINREIKTREQRLQDSAKKLNSVTTSIIEGLREFGARKLSIYKKEGIYYSEIMQLMSKIMNLKEEEVPLVPSDLSDILPTKTVNFQYNTVQVEGETKKHFGAIYSLKEYREITLDELDKLIQLPVNLIITQSFCFVKKQEALAAFEDQKKIYELSYSKYMSEISGIKELFDENADENTGYGEQQITVTVLEDTVKALQNSIFLIVDVLRDMGLFSVREDIFMENCYWSNMPANFDFTNRKTYLPFQRIAGFASLYNFTTGKLNNNKWGAALTTLQTAKGMPYFFNFHYGQNGHCIIISGESNDKETLPRFLISQAQKYEGKTYILETDKKSEVFVKALGGKYTDMSLVQNHFETDVLGINVTPDPAEIIRLLAAIESKLSPEIPAIIYLDKNITSQCGEISQGLCELMTRFTEKNAIMIFSAKESLKEKEPGIFSSALVDMVETKIFMPNPAADYNYKEIFKIKERELKAIKELNDINGEFIVKRHDDSVVIRFNSKEIKNVLLALSDAEENKINLQNSVSEAVSEEPEKWLPVYLSKKKL